MNKQHAILITLLAMLCHSPSVWAASSTLDLTVSTTVQPSTCEALLADTNNTLITAVDIGDVLLSEVVNKSKYKPFVIRFSKCEGLSRNTAIIKLEKRTGCDGQSNNGAGYRNALSGVNAATGVSAEVWTENNAGGASASGTQLDCTNPPITYVDVEGASGTNFVNWPLSARMVIAKDKTASDAGAGEFSSLATFTIQYE